MVTCRNLEVRSLSFIDCRSRSQDHFQKHIRMKDSVVAVNASGGKGCRVSHKNFILGIITTIAVKYIAIVKTPECII